MGCLADEYFIQLVKEHPSSRIVLLAEHRDEVEDLFSALKPSLVLVSTSRTPWETLAIMSMATTFLDLLAFYPGGGLGSYSSWCINFFAVRVGCQRAIRSGRFSVRRMHSSYSSLGKPSQFLTIKQKYKK